MSHCAGDMKIMHGHTPVMKLCMSVM